MGIIDFVIIGIIVFSGLFALYRGLVRELLGLISWILAVLCGFFGMFLCRPLSTRFISNAQLADGVSAVVIALIVLVICTIINAKINKGLRTSVLSSLDRTLGFIFGILRGFIVVFGIYFFCVFALSEHTMKHYTEKNFLLPYLAKVQPYIEKLLPENWIKELSGTAKDGESQSILDEVDVKEKPLLNTKDATSYDQTDIQRMNKLIEGIE